MISGRLAFCEYLQSLSGAVCVLTFAWNSPHNFTPPPMVLLWFLVWHWRIFSGSLLSISQWIQKNWAFITSSALLWLFLLVVCLIFSLVVLYEMPWDWLLTGSGVILEALITVGGADASISLAQPLQGGDRHWGVTLLATGLWGLFQHKGKQQSDLHWKALSIWGLTESQMGFAGCVLIMGAGQFPFSVPPVLQSAVLCLNSGSALSWSTYFVFSLARFLRGWGTSGVQVGCLSGVCQSLEQWWVWGCWFFFVPLAQQGANVSSAKSFLTVLDGIWEGVGKKEDEGKCMTRFLLAQGAQEIVK